VKELAPKIFASVRSKDQITNDTIQKSLGPEHNRD